MRVFTIVLISLIAGQTAVFAQSDRGTITGTVTDPGGAVLVGAALEAVNTQTAAVYQAASTGTGNYTLAQIPTGTYTLSVTAPGFKTFIRQNIVVPVAQTVRIDATLQVGATTESVTVTDAAPLLKTESGELSVNVKTSTLNNLPVLGIGGSASASGVRNPYAVVQLLPGSDYRPDRSVRINGMPSNSQSLRIEGQDATNNLIYNQSQTQPSVDAIEEFAIQTSNFAAEYGQVGGGFFNATMKSGTNQFHGSAYEYFVNEALNAGVPFTNNGQGSLLRPRNRRHDYGFTLGGPLWVPKVYNGHDKTFFFFNFEQFRETTITNNLPITVPTAAYRQGNFAAALTNRNVCPAATPNCDPLGRPIMENAIYDPLSTRIVNGQKVRDPFSGNAIPLGQQDPVALRVQALIPEANRPGLVNNYLTSYTNPTLTYIPSVKLDHQITASSKLSGYWSRTYTESPNNNALPFPLNSVPRSITAHTVRINFDQTVTPTLLLHFGVGLLHNFVNQSVGRFDPVAGIGLRGTYTDLFPSLQGLTSPQGGMANMGPGTNAQILNTKPTANVSLTWVRNNHTIKAGGELIVEGYPTYNETYANGWITFSKLESGLPSTNGQSLAGGTPGFNYGSFLLGGVNNGFIGIPSKTRLGNKALAGFVQDTWKVTRKLTVDYGLRYDFQTYLREQYGRVPYFAPFVVHPDIKRLGAVAFEGTGPGRCDCDIANNYPHAWGPRLGVAYQVFNKTVVRAGVGVSYYRTAMNGLNSYSTGSQNIYNAPVYGDPAYSLRDGLPYSVVWPNFNIGQTPLPGTIASPAQQVDQNAGRPARILQWSIGVQREIASNLVVEATYVANRGAYWNSTYLVCPNCNQATELAKAGLDIRNAADRLVLSSPLNSPVSAQRGYNFAPYQGFPAGSPVAQAMRPFPHFGNITNMKWVPTGRNWYDSLQAQLTKRFSHGLDLTSSFTWSRSFVMGTEADISTLSVTTPPTNDVFNRRQNKYLSGMDQPFLFVLAGNYTTPNLSVYKPVSILLRDWTFGAVMRYASGLPIMSPLASNGLNALLFRSTGAVGTTGGTYMNRVPGQQFFTQDLNCRCYDPNTTFVLNPSAWVNPPAGEWGTAAAYYTDYRYRRRPSESMSIARNFRMGPEGGYNLQVRAEFSNIFNRTQPNDPSSNNALATQQRNASGQATAGFGWINTASVAGQPRQGTIVARFTF